jgi:putative SOS response-associated peptidase YedK
MKIPFSIGMKDDSPFVFAGLWEGWKDPATDEWLRTCTIITGDPNDLVAQIHTRMPVILPEEHHARWLGEVENGDPKELFKPFPADLCRAGATSALLLSMGSTRPSPSPIATTGTAHSARS